MLTYAIDKDSHELVHIDDVPNGNKCNCKCPNPECGDELNANNGGKSNRAHHFKHQVKIEGKSCLVSQLHIWGQLYFQNLKKFSIPAPIIELDDGDIAIDQNSHIQIEAMSSVLEKQIDKYRADVYIEAAIEDLVIEIKVSHECDDQKVQHFVDNRIASVEIDLSMYVDTPIEEVEKAFDEKYAEIKWIYPYDKEGIIARYLEDKNQKELKRHQGIRLKNERLINRIKNKMQVNLPDLTSPYTDSNGTKRSLVLQNRLVLPIDRIDMVTSNTSFEHYECIVKRGPSSKVLNIIAYISNEPDFVSKLNSATLVIPSETGVLTWRHHTRYSALLKTATEKLENEIAKYDHLEYLVAHEEDSFSQHGYRFKTSYGKWKNLLIRYRVFSSTPEKPNPSIPRALRDLNHDDSLWMFDSWPVYVATILIDLIDMYPQDAIDAESLFSLLEKEIGISQKYYFILDYAESNKLKNKVLRDKQQVIHALIYPLLHYFQGDLRITNGVIYKNPDAPIFSRLFQDC